MNNYYVYLHRRLTDNKVFYVGKGKNKRAWTTSGRNNRWTKTYKKHGRYVELIFENLSEQDAFEIERDVICEMSYHFNSTLCNMTKGGEGTSGIRHSAERKRQIGEHSKSRSHLLRERNTDSNIYRFLKVDSLEVVQLTRTDLAAKYEFDVNKLRPLFLKNKSSNVSNGFALIQESETIEDCIKRISYKKKKQKYKVLSAKRYTDIYCFVSSDGTAIWSNLENFMKVVGRTIKYLVQNPDKCKTTRGWSVMINRSFDEALNCARREHKSTIVKDNNIYSFIRRDGLEFIGTRHDLVSKYNLPSSLALSGLFSKRKRKWAYDWSLKKEQNE